MQQCGSFTLLKKSSQCDARLGKLYTTRGTINTPVFMPVGTNATVKAMPKDFLEEIGFLGNRIFRCRWLWEIVLGLFVEFFLLHRQWDGTQGVHCRLAFCPEDAVGQFCLAVVH